MLGEGSHSLPSYSTMLKARRRASQIQARGPTEIAIYERFNQGDHSDEEDEEMQQGSEDEEDVQERQEPALDMDMDEDEEMQEDAPARADVKGKGKAIAQDSSPEPSLPMRKSKKRRAYSYGGQQPARQKSVIILLKQSAGWTFSQDAFFPTYMRDQYYLASTSTSPPNGSAEFKAHSYSSNSSLAEREFIDDQEDLQPQVTDIILP